MRMNNFLKIGVPILVAVLVLIIGTGLVLAKIDTPVFTGSQASYDAGYAWCPQQCQGPQGCVCPQQANCAGNCPGFNGGAYLGCGGANCSQGGYCGGYCGGAGAANTGYRSGCGGCRR